MAASSFRLKILERIIVGRFLYLIIICRLTQKMLVFDIYHTELFIQELIDNDLIRVPNGWTPVEYIFHLMQEFYPYYKEKDTDKMIAFHVKSISKLLEGDKH